MKIINNELIRSLTPCYYPTRYVTDENETLSVLEWVNKYRGTVPDKDIIWLLCHKEFLSDKDLRLFAVWCARESLNLIDNPDPRSIEACNVAERYANGEATRAELEEARYHASNAAYAAATRCAARAAHAAADAARAAADAGYAAYAVATRCAARAAADAGYAAYHAATRASQLDKLLTYFK